MSDSPNPIPLGMLPMGRDGDITGVLNEQLNSSTAAANASSSLVDGRREGEGATEPRTPETELPALGLGNGRCGRWLGNEGPVGGALPARNPLVPLYDREYDPDEYRFPGFPAPLRMPRGVGTGLDRLMLDGGVVSSEDELSELPSLFDAPDEESGGVGFIDTRIDAASSSCTC